MRLAVGFAGVPQAIYDRFWASRMKIIEQSDILICESLKTDRNYSNQHSNFFLNRFHEILRNDHHNSFRDVGFVIIYVSTHENSDFFSSIFFPSILTIPVNWKLSGYNKTTFGASYNELSRLFRQSVIAARGAIPKIRREVVQQDNRTPWLLPLKNFQSSVYETTLSTLHDRCIDHRNLDSSIATSKQIFERAHPPRKVRGSTRHCYVDDKGVEFHPPGKARHAFARASFDNHPSTCLIAGRLRLGASYDRAFHYDCSRGERPLKGCFAGCHSEPVKWIGDPHLNIAPNDFVRC